MPIELPIDLPGISSTGAPNQYSIDDILQHPEEFKEFISDLENMSITAEALKIAKKDHISFTEAINQKYKEYLQERLKIESEINKIRRSKAYTRINEMSEFQRKRLEQQLNKLEYKLQDLQNQRTKYANAAIKINNIVNNVKFYGSLAGFGTGIGATIYKISKDNKKEREEKDLQYVQQLTQGTPQQAMVQLEIDKENALNKCHNDRGKANIEEHYEELKSKLVDYYSKESSAKIVNEPSVQPTENASIAQAVQNARKKYRLGGILKYKQYE